MNVLLYIDSAVPSIPFSSHFFTYIFGNQMLMKETMRNKKTEVGEAFINGIENQPSQMDLNDHFLLIKNFYWRVFYTVTCILVEDVLKPDIYS